MEFTNITPNEDPKDNYNVIDYEFISYKLCLLTQTVNIISDIRNIKGKLETIRKLN